MPFGYNQNSTIIPGIPDTELKFGQNLFIPGTAQMRYNTNYLGGVSMQGGLTTDVLAIGNLATRKNLKTKVKEWLMVAGATLGAWALRKHIPVVGWFFKKLT